MITNVPSYCANPHEQTIANHCAKPHLHLKTIASPYPIALVRAWYVICDKRYLHCSDTQISHHRKCRLAWHGYGLVSSQSDSSQICLCPDQRCICVDSNQNFHFLKQRKAKRVATKTFTFSKKKKQRGQQPKLSLSQTKKSSEGSNQNFHFLKQRKAERAVLILITGNFQCDKKPWGATD